MSDEIKIIKTLAGPKLTMQDKARLSWHYLLGLVGVSIGFVALLTLISFLPMAGYLKTISLLLGGFLLLDIHHSLKAYVRGTIG